MFSYFTANSFKIQLSFQCFNFTAANCFFFLRWALIWIYEACVKLLSFTDKSGSIHINGRSHRNSVTGFFIYDPKGRKKDHCEQKIDFFPPKSGNTVFSSVCLRSWLRQIHASLMISCFYSSLFFLAPSFFLLQNPCFGFSPFK